MNRGIRIFLLTLFFSAGQIWCMDDASHEMTDEEFNRIAECVEREGVVDDLTDHEVDLLLTMLNVDDKTSAKSSFSSKKD